MKLQSIQVSAGINLVVAATGHRWMILTVNKLHLLGTNKVCAKIMRVMHQLRRVRHGCYQW